MIIAGIEAGGTKINCGLGTEEGKIRNDNYTNYNT